MTVSELIEKLKQAPADAEVITQGCDCHGDVFAVAIANDPDEAPSILLMRSDENFHLGDGWALL